MSRPTHDQSGDQVFEREVRRIAEALWPQSAGGTSADGGRERDGVYFGAEYVHCVEATVTSTVAKTQNDVTKLAEYIRDLQRKYQSHHVRGYMVCKSTITKHQLDCRDTVVAQAGLRPADIVVEDFDRFRRRLFDPSAYVQVRRRYPFGSVASPLSGRTRADDEDRLDAFIDDYIPIDLTNIHTGNLVSVRAMSDDIAQGKRFVLLGDYGAGKSMTMREVFMQMKKPVLRGDAHRFPLAINLREHHGQPSPTTALTHHASLIGVSGQMLINAWQAGYAHILLDGFDELSTGRPLGSARRIRESRFEASRLIRSFIAETPCEAGMMIAGRGFYFDDTHERDKALGTSSNFQVLRINEFTHHQVEKYLRKHGHHGDIPEWLPSRPLLLGYLVASKLLSEALDIGVTGSIGKAWNLLLDKICEREAVQVNVLSGGEIREVIERLASFGRTLPQGIGPFSVDHTLEIFRAVCGRTPEEADLVQLNRLPGLGIMPRADDEPNPISQASSAVGRYFVDEDLADAARAGDVRRYVAVGARTFWSVPSTHTDEWRHPLEAVGVDTLAAQLDDPARELKASSYLINLASDDGRHYLAFDVFQVCLRLGELKTKDNISIHKCDIHDLDLSSCKHDMSNATFESCSFESVVLGEGGPDRGPVFSRCVIEQLLSSPISAADYQNKFPSTDIDRVEELYMTTHSILRLRLSVGERVLLTILKKLYRQRGSGRQASSFVRGLPHEDRKYVGDALAIVRKYNLATEYTMANDSVWIPNRSRRTSVLQVLASSKESDVDFMVAARQIG